MRSSRPCANPRLDSRSLFCVQQVAIVGVATRGIRVNRVHGQRNCFELYPRHLHECLPRIRVRLADGDPDVVLDVRTVLAQTDEAGSYGERLHYDWACVPSLSAEEQSWADERIRAARVRRESAPRESCCPSES